VQPDQTSIRALRLLQDQMAYLENLMHRPAIQNFGVVPGLYRRPLSTYAKMALDDLRNLGLPMLPSVPLSVAINEAAAHGMPVTTYAPETVQAVAFRQIALIINAKVAQSDWDPTQADQDFVFEEFISDINSIRNRKDAASSSRRKLYDLLPKKRHGDGPDTAAG
jgi:chromosome partitioning protein